MRVAVAVGVGVAVAVVVAVTVAVAVQVALAVAVRVAVAVEVPVAVSVAVAVEVGVAVRVAVAVAGGLAFGPVVNPELKSSFSDLPLRALTVPTNLTLYFVLIASAPIGTRVAVSPSQKTLVARMRTSLTASSRKVRGFSVSHFIGMSKTTVMEVKTDTSRVPLAGSMETTVGRSWSLAAAAGDTPAHTIITNAATKTLLTMCLSTIVARREAGSTLLRQGLCRSVISNYMSE